MDLVRQLFKDARPFKPCALFRGDETFDEMMQLFLSPQGLEFCVSHDFPRRERLQALKEAGISSLGIHIDEGRGKAVNALICVLVGDTDFELEYDTLDYACRVVLMKGARCVIKAGGYSVVSVLAQKGCEVVKVVSGHAIVR